jgi:hypothetical protein
MSQVYGGRQDIENHFNYLLPFFKDQRYILVDNKPLFLLYRANSITYLDEMIDTWNQCAIKEGFNGIFFVETLTGFQKKKTFDKVNALVYMEPAYAGSINSFFEKIYNKLQNIFLKGWRISYKKIWKRIIMLENICNNSFAGAFLDWDNTPRRKRNYYLLKKVEQDYFCECFSEQYFKASKNDCPFIFINAWNEWAEGTYLEPDTKNKYFYLETIKNIQMREIR